MASLLLKLPIKFENNFTTIEDLIQIKIHTLSPHSRISGNKVNIKGPTTNLWIWKNRQETWSLFQVPKQTIVSNRLPKTIISDTDMEEMKIGSPRSKFWMQEKWENFKEKNKEKTDIQED